MSIDTDEVAELLKWVSAEIIDPRFRSLSDEEIHRKGPGDVVTDADRRAEEALGGQLVARAGGVVVGEEAAFADPHVLDALADGELVWVIDPIDGTRNFVKGSPDHGVMLAELHHGVTVRSWIWQSQHRHMWIAEKGAGLTRDGQPVSRGHSGRPVRAATTHESYKVAADDLTWVSSRWCCAVDYPLVCDGTNDATVYLHSHPWDHLPGALMVREVGGVVRTLDGVDYDHAVRSGRLVVAADEDAHRAVARVLGRR